MDSIVCIHHRTIFSEWIPHSVSHMHFFHYHNHKFIPSIGFLGGGHQLPCRRPDTEVHPSSILNSVSMIYDMPARLPILRNGKQAKSSYWRYVLVRWSTQFMVYTSSTQFVVYTYFSDLSATFQCLLTMIIYLWDWLIQTGAMSCPLVVSGWI
jgi:hypothetical protein